MRLSARAEAVLLPLAAIAIAVALGAVLIALDGASPWVAYRSLLDGSLGGPDSIARTLERATPLIFTGLAVTVGMKSGLFNIGAQGQLLTGAVFAAYIGYRFSLPGIVHVPVAIIVGGLCGLLPAALAGYLKAYRGAHEVITTIMLNAILVSLTEWAVGARGPFHDPNAGAISRTPLVRESAIIPHLGAYPLGFFLGVAVAIVIWFIFARTTAGFRMTTVGQNKFAAQYGGMSAARITVAAMALSGFLAGVGGSIETLGVFGRFESGRNVGLGFDGITVALLARTNPLMAVPSALLLGLMRAGQSKMAFESKVAPEIIDVILAIILLLVCAPILVRWLLRVRRADDDGAESIQLTSGWGAS